MKISGRTQPLAGHPIHEALGLLAECGFDGVEICLENPDIAPDELTDDLIESVRRRVEELGLAPVSVSYHTDYVYSDEELARSLRAIQSTPRFGAEVFVFSGTVRRTGDEAEWGRMIERTGRLVEAADRAGVTLAEEFEPDFIVGSTADLLRLFSELPSRRLGANLDLGHVFLCDDDPLGAIRSLAGKVIHGHVEGMAAGVHDHLLPHEGDMDLASYFAALREIGFDGPLALDLYRHEYASVAPAALEYLRSL